MLFARIALTAMATAHRVTGTLAEYLVTCLEQADHGRGRYRRKLPHRAASGFAEKRLIMQARETLPGEHAAQGESGDMRAAHGA